MLIGELAEATRVSVRALRYYEEQGLLVPRRKPNGYREYPPEAVDRVAQIQLLFSAGLCGSKIAELLPCIYSENGRVKAGPALTDDLEREVHRIQRQIDDMQASLRILEDVLAGSKETSDVSNGHAELDSSPT